MNAQKEKNQMTDDSYKLEYSKKSLDFNIASI